MIKKAERCSKCHRPLPRKKKSTRAANGIRKESGGKERCVTKAAWQLRRMEVYDRDQGVCVQRLFDNGQPVKGAFHVERKGYYKACGRLLLLADAHIHHIRKRSLGRDDRPENLVTLCEEHHALYDSKTQWSRR